MLRQREHGRWRASAAGPEHLAPEWRGVAPGAEPTDERAGDEDDATEQGDHPQDSPDLAAGVLAVSIVLMFGMAMVWRRMNPA